MVPDSKQSLARLASECVSPAPANLSDMSPFDIVRTMNGEDAAVWVEVDRSVLILRTISGLDNRAAQDLLTGSDGELKVAIVASLAGTDMVGACELLARSGGIVRAVVEGNRFPMGDIS